MPTLFALLTVFAGLAVGVALLVGGHLFAGVVVCLSGFPIALGVWLKANDRTAR